MTIKKDKTQYFVNSKGEFIGAYSYKNTMIPSEAIEVLSPPAHGLLEIWNFNNQEWVVNKPEKIKSLRQELIEERKKYLESTDWEALAFIKRGRPISEITKTNNITAVKEMEEINKISDLESLKKFIKN